MSYFRPPDKTTWVEGRVRKPKKKVVYRVHINPEPRDFTTKKEAVRQAKNWATACQKPILVTRELVTA
jgi:hypothetical protein